MKTMINLYILTLCSVCIVADIIWTQKKIDRFPCIPCGEDTEQGPFPYYVSIRRNFWHQDYHWCGGAIISDRFVLTTAHCTEYSSAIDLLGIIGTVKSYDDGVYIRFSHIINHPAYDNKGEAKNDISILCTAEQIIFSNNIQPIALPTNDAIDKRKMFIVSGLGSGDSGGPLVGHNGELIGAVSWVAPCALGIPDVFASVYQSVSWIQSEMKKLN